MITTDRRLFKVLKSDGTARVTNEHWSLPILNDDGIWTPGDWMPSITGELADPENGYHLYCEDDLIPHLGPTVYEAEYRGEWIAGLSKILVCEARLLRQLKWDQRIARLFACKCAERVLPIFERRYPNDDRPRLAIETARKHIDYLVAADAGLEPPSAHAEIAHTEILSAFCGAVASSNTAQTIADSVELDTFPRAVASVADAAVCILQTNRQAFPNIAAGVAHLAICAVAYAELGSIAACSAKVAERKWQTARSAKAAERQWQTAHLMEYIGY